MSFGHVVRHLETWCFFHFEIWIYCDFSLVWIIFQQTYLVTHPPSKIQNFPLSVSWKRKYCRQINLFSLFIHSSFLDCVAIWKNKFKKKVVALVQHVIHPIVNACHITDQDSHHKGTFQLDEICSFFPNPQLDLAHLYLTIKIHFKCFYLFPSIHSILFVLFQYFACFSLLNGIINLIRNWYGGKIILVIFFFVRDSQQCSRNGIPFATRPPTLGQMALCMDVDMGTSTPSSWSFDAFAWLGTCTSIQLGRMEKESECNAYLNDEKKKWKMINLL